MERDLIFLAPSESHYIQSRIKRVTDYGIKRRMIDAMIIGVKDGKVISMNGLHYLNGTWIKKDSLRG